MNVALMLELYRRAAVPFVAENIKLFKAMTQAEQTELLFYMIMDQASQSASPDAAAFQHKEINQ
jgi:hypothetical protein